MQRFIALFTAIIGLGLVAYASSTLKEDADRRYQLVSIPPLAHLPPQLLEIITLGHKGLYDDFANVWALQFLSDPRLKDEDPDIVFATLKTIAAQRIKIESFYMLSCFVLALELNHPEYCEPLALAGTEGMPASWRIPFTQGFIFTSMMDDPLKAAAYLKIASSRPGAPKHIERRIRKLLAGQNLDRQQLMEALESLIPPDSKMGALLLEKNLQTRPQAGKERRPNR